MPPLSEFRVVVAALPPAVYSRAGGLDFGAPSLRSMIEHMWEWSQGSDPLDRMADISLHDRNVGVPKLLASLMEPHGKTGRGNSRIASAGAAVLQAAADATPGRMAALRALVGGGGAPTTSPAYRFSTLSWRDLERVVTAGLMLSPYARVADLRNMSDAELAATNVVLLPYPLSRLRASSARASQLTAVMSEFAPTLARRPAKHAFVLARILRDLSVLKSLTHTLRPIVKREPFHSANYWSFEPYWNGINPHRQHVLPYPGSVQRSRLGPPAATPRGRSNATRQPLRRVPLWAPADPSVGASDPCDPLGPDGVVQAHTPRPGCSAAQAMAAVRASRPLLASFLGAPRGSMPERMSALREMHGHCDDCGVFDVSNPVFSGGYGMPWVYSHSVFCVQPHGDSPSRKAFFDALLYGCIPVVLDKRKPGSGRAPVLPYSHLLPYHEFTVLVTKQTWFGGLGRVLKRIDPGRIRAMQVSLARHAHLLSFPMPPARVDVGVLLRRSEEGGLGGRSRGGEGGGGSRRGDGDGGGDGDGPPGCAQDAIDMLIRDLWGHGK